MELKDQVIKLRAFIRHECTELKKEIQSIKANPDVIGDLEYQKLADYKYFYTLLKNLK